MTWQDRRINIKAHWAGKTMKEFAERHGIQYQCVNAFVGGLSNATRIIEAFGRDGLIVPAVELRPRVREDDGTDDLEGIETIESDTKYLSSLRKSLESFKRF